MEARGETVQGARAEETLDRLSGDWWIYQLRRGHRYTTDDVICAWTALRSRPDALRILDLGSGTGALGMLVLARLPPEARLVGVEIQPESVALARRSAARNGLESRAEFRRGDLRDPALLGSERFDLVLANPPYLRADRATHSPYAHRRTARLELHGDVFDYCRAAKRCLTDGGIFCFCHAAADPRPELAAAEAGLAVLARREVRFRQDKAPRIAVFRCAERGQRADEPPIEVRRADGTRSEAYVAIRRELCMEA
ncbi:MAG: methyltransferase domain-containing protein [Deltaproteobacteria bacterium]|nr:methyltransferase domain-containing protein [Deltaproteobacteria bacterium]